VFNKDAMADVITEKAVELVESKQDEIVEKVLEKVEEKKEEIEKKVDEVADKAEAAIESAAEQVGKKIDNILDKLDDNPQIAKAIDVLDDIVGDQLNGREVSCACWGFLWSLRITRKVPQSPPAKSEATPKTELPAPTPSVPAKEESPATVPQQPQTDAPAQS
jgi:hypothetical protein